MHTVVRAQIYRKMNCITTLGKYALFVALVMSQFLADGQKSYEPGYIIKLDGDTIGGYIDYKNWNRNPVRVKFKESTSRSQESYGLLDIKGFKVNNELYLSEIVDIEVSPRSINDLNENKDFDLKKDTAFVRAIVVGEKSLYAYKDRNGRDHFYIGKPDSLELLKYKRYIIRGNQGEGDSFRENAAYHGQLSYYFRDCFSIQQKLQETDYKSRELGRLFKVYYECSENILSYKSNTEGIKMAFGLVAGITNTSLGFEAQRNSGLLLESEYNTSTDFAAGLYLDFFFPRKFSRWSVCTELLFNGYHIEGQHVITETSFNLAYLKVIVMPRYHYSITEKVSLFANIGLANGFAVRHDIDLGNAQIFLDRRHEQSLLAGLGATVGRFSLEGRYERGNGMSNSSNYNSITDRYYVLLGYRIKG